MALEIVAPAVLVLVALVVVVYTQWLKPRRVRRALAATLAGQGWTRVDPGQEPHWSEVAALAVEENQGAFRAREYDERIGPATFHVKRTERRSGRTLDLYREGGASHPRYAAVGIQEKRTVSSGFAHYRQGTTVSREIWIGEARQLPAERREMVFSGFSELLGARGREMARARGLDPEAIQHTASPPADTLALALREVLLRDDLARNLMVSLFVGPRAWVLVAPLPRLGRRLDAFLALAREVSAAADWRAGWGLSGAREDRP